MTRHAAVEGFLTEERLADLERKLGESYVVRIDLRDLAELCQRARLLEDCRATLAREVTRITVDDERLPLAQLLERIA